MPTDILRIANATWIRGSS